MTALPGECGMKWPLDNPNAEDQALGRTHECWLPPAAGDVFHRHQCRCGAWMPGT